MRWHGRRRATDRQRRTGQTKVTTGLVDDDGFQLILTSHGFPSVRRAICPVRGHLIRVKPPRTDGGLTYVEICTWVEGGFDQAHEHPDVIAIWEPMEPLLEDHTRRSARARRGDDLRCHRGTRADGTRAP